MIQSCLPLLAPFQVMHNLNYIFRKCYRFICYCLLFLIWFSIKKKKITLDSFFFEGSSTLFMWSEWVQVMVGRIVSLVVAYNAFTLRRHIISLLWSHFHVDADLMTCCAHNVAGAAVCIILWGAVLTAAHIERRTKTMAHYYFSWKYA